MTQINPNFENKYVLSRNNVGFKSVPAVPVEQVQTEEVELPDIYYQTDNASEKTFKEKIKEADMMNMVYPWIEHPILMIGTCAGLAYGVDKFAAACGGEYEKSLVGKAAKFGDNLQNSTFVQSSPVQTVIGWGRKGKNKIAHFFRNSDVLNAIFKTPSKPQNSMVLHEMFSMDQRMVHEFNRIVTTLKLAGEKANKQGDLPYVKLKDLGVDKSEKEFIKNFFKASTPSEEAISSAVQLKRLGCSEAEITNVLSSGEPTKLVKAEYLKKWGEGITVEKLNQLIEAKDIKREDVELVKKITGKTRNVKIGVANYKLLGPAQIFARNIGCDEINNRMMSLTLNEGAKTRTGKFMASFLQQIHRGFTFGGGKLGVLAFVAPHLVETMIDVKKADPKEKIGTAAHGLVESVSWVFTFPLALKIMHHLAGAQYAGMSQEKIDAVRAIKDNFNKTVFENEAAYAKELKRQKKRVKALERVRGQNLLTQICRKLGKFVTIDLERFKSYRNGGVIGNTLRKIPGAGKNILGVPMRLGIWGVLSMGVLGGALTKATKAIFGNFYDRYKEEEHESKKKGQKEFLKQDLRNRLYEAQAQKIAAAQGNAPVANIEQNNLQGVAVPPPNIAERIKVNPENVQEESQIVSKPQVETQIEKVPNQPVNEQPIIEQKSNEQINSSQNKQIEDVVLDKPTMDQKEVNPVQQEEILNEIPPVSAPFNNISQEKIVPQMVAQTDKLKSKKIDDYTYIPSSVNNIKKDNKVNKVDNYTYIPSSENVIKKNEKETNSYKYIPSQVGAKFTKTFDNSGLEAALKRADRAEQKALQVLAGKFNGM